MIAGRSVVFMCVASVACGRLGFDGGGGRALPEDAPPTDEDHLQVADGWSIAPLFDFSGVVPYNAADFIDKDPDGQDEILDNAPSYVAALYPPFGASFVVIAGRSLIEIPEGGTATEHVYAPPPGADDGIDAPSRATFADLGDGKIGLWVTSESKERGDGLFLLHAEDWMLERKNDNNNTTALGLGSVADATALYVSYFSELEGVLVIDRLTTAGATTMRHFGQMSYIGDLAVIGETLFVTVLEPLAPDPALWRIGAGVPVELQAKANLSLAEGSTDAGLFAIKDQRELVTVDAENGAFERKAWTDDDRWVWRAVSAPRAGHPRAGQLVVLESNRTSEKDRLLLVTPPP